MERFLLVGGGPKGLDAKLMVEWGFDIVCLETTENIQKYRDNLSRATALYEIKDKSDYRAIVEISKEAHQKHPFSNAVSFTEWGLLPAAHICDAFGFKGNGVEAVDATVDKIKMRTLLQKNHLSSIKFATINTFEQLVTFCEGVKYACILKDPHGSGKMDLFIINKKEDLLKYEGAIKNCLNKYDFMLSEEFVCGTEISVETFLWNEKLKFIAYTKKHTIPPYNVEVGHTMPAVLSETQKNKISNYITSCLKVLGVKYGICHNEIIFSDDKMHFIETHTRPGGGCIYDLIIYAYGVDIIKEACNYAGGNATIIGGSPHSSAASRFFCPPAGYYKNILGKEIFENNSLIKDYFLELPDNNYFPEITNNDLRHCYIVACDSCSADQLDIQVGNLINKITFVPR